MIVGVPKEIKDNEYRVGITPSGVRELNLRGHEALIEQGAGIGSGIRDEEYRECGGIIIENTEELFARAEMIVKVKEPLPIEYDLLRPGQVLFTFLHLAADPGMTRALLDKEIIGVAYETIRDRRGSLPLLTPMSTIAGKVSVQVGAACLQKDHGGSGVLLGGIAGVEKGKVGVIGGGVVGMSAARMALGLGAETTVMDINYNRLAYLEDIFSDRIKTLFSNMKNIEKVVETSDLVIGAILIPGAKAPHLVTKEMLSLMRPGSVIVDVAVDQGGCVETTRPTTHSDPTFVVDEVIHYCVSNIPGIVSRTATFALTHATLPYMLQIAEKGLERAVNEDKSLRYGLNIYKSDITCRSVADSLKLKYMDPKSLH
jgi:alanine dehydrogenase